MNLTNQQRATRAAGVLKMHALSCDARHDTPQDQLTDLLTNLRHYCDQQSIQYSRSARLANDRYLAEADVPDKLVDDLAKPTLPQAFGAANH